MDYRKISVSVHNILRIRGNNSDFKSFNCFIWLIDKALVLEIR